MSEDEDNDSTGAVNGSTLAPDDASSTPTGRNSILDWRSDSMVSYGASQDLIRRRGRTSSRLSQRLLGEMPNYITSIIEDLQWALRELGQAGSMRVEDIEKLAILIHENLTKDSRGYHGVAHMFEICASASPLQILASFFRDLLKNYIDEETDPELDAVLKRFVIYEEIGGESVPKIVDSLPSDVERMVVSVFGYQEGDTVLPHMELHGGMDIMFSAFVGSQFMKDALTPRQVCQMSALIEATIPFRRPQHAGDPTALEILYQRLIYCNQQFDLKMANAEIVETVQQGADLLNRQVGNMVTDDLAIFLDHTWSLLPEENASLRKRSLYTLYEYYSAIYKMYGFLSKLDAPSICVSFHGVPAESEMTAFSLQLSINLELSIIYIQARLLSIALVVAFATLTGGDAPKSFFFGDLPAFHNISERLGESLPVEEVAATFCNAEVLDVLRGNRMSETGFDTRNAPLAAFVYSHVGDTLLSELIVKCQLPMETDDCWTLLKAMPTRVVKAVGDEVGRITISRDLRIQRILRQVDIM
jgi:hypothetical protein